MKKESRSGRPALTNLHQSTHNKVVTRESTDILIVTWSGRCLKLDNIFPLPEGADLSSLPGFHALLNSMAAVFLVLAIRAIKKGQVILHQKMIYAAFICSLVFLLSYVTYHITTPATLFGDANKDGLLSSAEREAVSGTRPYYLFILISHIGLAALSFPFILRTFVHAFTNQFEKHRKLSKKVFPVWLYVAVTGPVVYFFLQPYY